MVDIIANLICFGFTVKAINNPNYAWKTWVIQKILIYVHLLDKQASSITKTWLLNELNSIIIYIREHDTLFKIVLNV